MVSLGSSGPQFEPLSAVELTPGVVDSLCHPSEVGEMSTSVLVIGALHQRYRNIRERRGWGTTAKPNGEQLV